MTDHAPLSWERYFIESHDPRILLEGKVRSGKRRVLLQAAGHQLEVPWRRTLVLASSETAKAEIVREMHALYAELPGAYAAQYSEWRFFGGAVIRVAAGLAEARAPELYDRVCVDHVEEFGWEQLTQAVGMLRQGPGRTPTVRGTRRVERELRHIFPVRVAYDLDAAPDLGWGVMSPATAALEEVILALTQHLEATNDGLTWSNVVRARERVPRERLERELRDLLQAIDAAEADRGTLLSLLERARHRLAEIEGAAAGACHRTCPADCSLRPRR
ncbi:hypothetical protein [Sorangium sp. So ce1024]|uniref:hypothetical protein n=1 Tax=Sorangium sp. So ce1024 TaxID=3133327 RepID=UPI003F0A9F4E